MKHGPSAHKRTMKIRSRRRYVGVATERTKADLFWRDEPEYECDLDADGHNELLPRS